MITHVVKSVNTTREGQKSEVLTIKQRNKSMGTSCNDNNYRIVDKLSARGTLELINKVKVEIVNTSNNDLPAYKKHGDAGMDIRAFLQEPITLLPGKRALVPTGLKIALPVGFEAQVRPRSGLALNHGITVLNTPGTIDSGYRGDMGVILINLGEEPFTIYNGDRIAQLVIAKYETAIFEEVDQLPVSNRGEGGFGHSGIK